MDKKEPTKDTKKKRKYGKSFYIIFALCMVAMAGAAWSAYTSVNDYMQPSVIETNPKTEDTKAPTDATAGAQTTQPTTAKSERFIKGVEIWVATECLQMQLLTVTHLSKCH